MMKRSSKVLITALLGAMVVACPTVAVLVSNNVQSESWVDENGLAFSIKAAKGISKEASPISVSKTFIQTLEQKESETITSYDMRFAVAVLMTDDVNKIELKRSREGVEDKVVSIQSVYKYLILNGDNYYFDPTSNSLTTSIMSNNYYFATYTIKIENVQPKVQDDLAVDIKVSATINGNLNNVYLETSYNAATAANPCVQTIKSSETVVGYKNRVTHDFNEPDYSWDASHNCRADITCKNCALSTLVEQVAGTYVKDTDATCEINEKGHYFADFTNPDLTDQATAKNSVEVADTALGHDFDDVTEECINNCGTQSITSRAFADTSKLVSTTDYTCPAEYGNLYKYNDYAKNIFTSYSLEGLTEIKFYIVHPDANNSFILNGNTSNCVGGIYGGPNTADGIKATKSGNDWTVVRTSGKTMFTLPSWANQPSYTIENPTTFNEIFATFTYASQIYISDIIVQGNPSGQKEVLNNAYFVGKSGNNTYSLTDTGEKIIGLGKKYTYKSLYGDTTTDAAFRELFNDIDITEFKTISFYISVTDNYLTFVDDDGKDDSTSGAYGLHAMDGASTPGIITAYNQGNGTWRVTASGFKFRKVSDASKVSEFTYNNRNTLKALFQIGTSNSWHKNPTTVSDVVVTK